MQTTSIFILQELFCCDKGFCSDRFVQFTWNSALLLLPSDYAALKLNVTIPASDTDLLSGRTTVIVTGLISPIHISS